MMHGREKSDSAIVAGKPTNKAVPTAAESVEDRYSFIVVDLHRLHGGLSRIKRQLKVLFLRFESVLARFGLWLPKTSDSCVSMV